MRKVISRRSSDHVHNLGHHSNLFASLPADLQSILLEEGRRSAENLTKATVAQDEQFADLLRKAGTQIISDVDIAAFQKASSGVYQSLPNLTPGFVDKARAVMAGN